MSSGSAFDTSRRIKAGLWREEVLARAERLEARATTLGRGYPPGITDEFVDVQVLQRVGRAKFLARDRLSPVELWSGSQVEDAWRELRLAEESLVQATRDTAQVTRYAHDALAHAKKLLDDADPRVVALTAALDDRVDPPDAQALRCAAVSVLEAAHTASDKQHQVLRVFRNQLRVVSAVLVILAVGVGVAALTVEAFPDGLLTVTGGISERVAVPIALMAGAIGALFSALPSLAQIPETATTFDPIREQAVLKIAVGAWSGLVGVIAVAAGLAPGVDQVVAIMQAANDEGVSTAGTGTTVGSAAGFVMIAALFGAGQEALTRFADLKASAVAPTR